MIDIAIPSDSNIKKKEHKKLKKYPALRKNLDKMQWVKATVVPIVIGALCAVTPKLDERHQTSQK